MQLFDYLKGRKAADPDSFYKLIAIVCVAFFCFAITAYSWYPGFIWADTADQLRQAHALYLNNWHPPIMALFWRFELWLFHGHPGMLVVTWIGLCAFALAYLLIAVRLPIYLLITLYLVLFFSPLIYGLSISVDKDMPLTWLSLLLAGMLVRPYLLRETGKVDAALFILAALFASLLRFNAAFIIAPLLVARFMPGGWKISFKNLLACLLLVPILLGMIPLLNAIVHTNNVFVAQSLEIFDIAGVNHYVHQQEVLANQNILQRLWQNDTVAQEQWKSLSVEAQSGICYSKWGWDNFGFWQKNICGQVGDRWRSLGKKGLSKEWHQTIKEHPVAYVRHRIGHWIYFLGFSEQGSHLSFIYGTWNVSPGIYNFEKKLESEGREQIIPRNLSKSMDDWFIRTPLSYGVTWMVLSLLTFLWTFRCSTKKAAVTNCLAFASLMYLTGYLFVGLATVWRYVLPSVFVEIAALVIFFLYPEDKEEEQKSLPQ